MNALPHLLRFPWVEALGWTLVHFLWQGALIGLLAWIFLRASHKTAPNVRYLITCGLMFGCIAAPVATFLFLSRSSLPAVVSHSITPQSGAGKETHGATAQFADDNDSPSFVKHTETPPPDFPVEKLQPEKAARPLISSLAVDAARWAVPVWLLGVVVLGLRLCFGWCRIQLWRARADPLADAGVLDAFAELVRGFPPGLRVRLLVSRTVPGPLTLGWLKPVILLPVQILTGLSREQIVAVLAHELAHIRRHDYLANLLQSTVEIALFYHPGVWWLGGRMRELREECCDEEAARACPSRIVYAGALAALAEITHASEPALAAAGGSLLARISRLLGRPRVEPVLSGKNAAWSLALAGVLAAALCMLHTAKSLAEEGKDKAATRIELHVIDPADQKPVAGAKVLVDAPGFQSTLTTDASGIAIISLPLARPEYVNVHVQKAGRVPRLINWSLKQPSFNLPARFVLQMEKGNTIGGVVRNVEGQPIAGAKAVLIIRGANMGGSEEIFDDIFERRVPTDKDGKWHFDEAPSNLRSLSVRLEHPDYVSNQDIHEHQPPADDFKKQTAALVMQPGHICEGIVTDEAGKPIPNVNVIYGEAGSGSNTFPSTHTGKDGHFRFAALPDNDPMTPIVTFISDDYAPELVELPAGPKLAPLNVKLGKGHPVRVRVTDSKGAPIAGAAFIPDTWKRYRPFTDCSWATDPDGTFTWVHAPAHPIRYAVGKEGFQDLEIVLQPEDQVQQIVLRKPAAVTGRVVDAATNKPLDAFTLMPGSYYPDHQDATSWQRGSAIKLSGGNYQFQFDYPVQMEGETAEPPTPGFHRIRIEAEGYAPAVSRPISNDEESASIDFALNPSPAIAGKVTKPGGDPAPGVQVIMAGGETRVQIENGICINGSHKLIVKTDANGGFTLPAPERNSLVAMLHPDMGYAITTWEKLKQSPDVTLQPWAALEIKRDLEEYKLHSGRFPGLDYPGEQIYPGDFGAPKDMALLGFDAKPIVNEQGHLVFSHLVAGEVPVAIYNSASRWVVSDGKTDFESPWPLFTVESGKTTFLDLEKSRRVVTGKIKMPPGIDPQDFRNSYLSIRTQAPFPPGPANLSNHDLVQWLIAWSRTPEGKAYFRDSQSVSVQLTGDGTFRSEPVLPGKHKISGVLMRPSPASGEVENFPVDYKFDLAEGSTDFDMGIIEAQSPQPATPTPSPSPSSTPQSSLTPEPGRVFGEIVDENGKPFPQADIIKVVIHSTAHFVPNSGMAMDEEARVEGSQFRGPNPIQFPPQSITPAISIGVLVKDRPPVFFQAPGLKDAEHLRIVVPKGLQATIHVTSAVDGKPVQGAHIDASYSGPPQLGAISAATDANGDASIPASDAGQVTLAVSAQGHAAGHLDVARLDPHKPIPVSLAKVQPVPAHGSGSAPALGSFFDGVVERPSIMGLTVSEVKTASGLELRVRGTDGNSAFIVTGVKSRQDGKEINILAAQSVVGFHGANPGQSGTFDYTLKIPAGVDEVTFGKKKAVIWKRGTPEAKATASPAATPLIDDMDINRAF